jgi:ABC-type transport system substrate-binding protein
MLLVGAGVVGSQEGRGLVIFSGSALATDADPVNYFFPRLYRYDPVTGAFEGAALDNLALMVDPVPTADREQTIRLRGDLLWSDGEPVSAWDVLAALTTHNAYLDVLDALRVIDDSTLTFRYKEPTCSNLAQVNPVVAPASTRFETVAQRFNNQHSDLISLVEWQTAFQVAGLSAQASVRAADLFPRSQTALTVPGISRSGARLGDLALLHSFDQVGITREDQFLSGDTNLLINPDLDRRADLLAQDDVQVYEAPGRWLYYLVFNLADTQIPRSAFTSKGELLDQGHNRFFADRRVRQAVQLGIDVQSIIEVFYQGAATPTVGTLSPVSPGYNPALPAITYDPGRAARLLDEAGWIDTDGDGIRNCYRCLHAESGTNFVVNLVASIPAADLIARQLGRIGIGSWQGGGNLVSQQFDLALTTYDADYVYVRSPDPDQSELLTRGADVIGSLGNVGSYYNPALEDLLQRARTVPGCAVSERAELYREAQALLAEDIPIIGLYTVHDLYLARGIQGFAPRPGDPFWNLDNWKVTQ